MIRAAFGGAIAFALLSVSAALAGSPTGKVYGGAGGNVQKQVQQGATPHVHTAATGGTLPFTGLDLGVAVVVALLLLTLGVTLRRASRKQS